jgi:hypothetical protein
MMPEAPEASATVIPRPTAAVVPEAIVQSTGMPNVEGTYVMLVAEAKVVQAFSVVSAVVVKPAKPVVYAIVGALYIGTGKFSMNSSPEFAVTKWPIQRPMRVAPSCTL